MPEESINDLMTDLELCGRLRISRPTLERHLKAGPPKKRNRGMVDDIRLIRHVQVGGRRRWVRSSVEEFISGGK